MKVKHKHSSEIDRYDTSHGLILGFNRSSYWADSGIVYSGKYFQRPDKFVRLI